MDKSELVYEMFYINDFSLFKLKVAVIGLLITCLIGAAVYLEYKRDLNAYLREDGARISSQISTSLSHYERFIKTSVNLGFLTGEVKNLLSKANQTIAPSDRHMLRTKLIDLMRLPFLQFQKDNIKRLHVYLKNGETFLKLQNPEETSDASLYRADLEWVLMSKKAVSGFSLSGNQFAFRVLIPVMAEKEFLGVIEVCIPFYEIRMSLLASMTGEFVLFLDKQVILKQTDQKIPKGFQSTELSEECLTVIENSGSQVAAVQSGDHTRHKGHLNPWELSNLLKLAGKESQHEISQRKLFHTRVRFENTDYLITFRPITDFKDNFSGFVAVIKQDEFMPGIQQRLIFLFLTGGLLVFFIAVVIIKFSGKIVAQVKLRKKLMEALPVAVFIKNESGQYEETNQRFLDLFSLHSIGTENRHTREVFCPVDAEKMMELDKRLLAGDLKKAEFEFTESVLSKDEKHLSVQKTAYFNRYDHEKKIIGVIWDNTQKENDKRALEKALAEVKTLQGIIPICSHCKQIRDEEGAWNAMEAYIQHHSEAAFSHGICPDCMTKHYAEFAEG